MDARDGGANAAVGASVAGTGVDVGGAAAVSVAKMRARIRGLGGRASGLGDAGTQATSRSKTRTPGRVDGALMMEPPPPNKAPVKSTRRRGAVLAPLTYWTIM